MPHQARASSPFRQTPFSALPFWAETNHAEAFAAFKRCAQHALAKPYRDTAFGGDHQAWIPIYQAATQRAEPNAARHFFEHHFECFTHKGDGFVTGFYEPEVPARLMPDAEFNVPLLARPDDLIKIDPEESHPALPKGTRFARLLPNGQIVPFADRRTIETSAPPSRALAFVASKIDAFFIHVQGAAKLILAGGTRLRISFDGKSGHDFTGPGRILADMGEIPLAEVTMQSIRAWFAANPARVDEILWQNRSYIFFKIADQADETLGPIAAAKVPLQAGFAMAVDRNCHRFGTPVFIGSESLNFHRLMIAQDTGSAIQGVARGDLFMGTGFAAGQQAGIIKHAAQFTFLWPKGGVAP